MPILEPWGHIADESNPSSKLEEEIEQSGMCVDSSGFYLSDCVGCGMICITVIQILFLKTIWWRTAMFYKMIARARDRWYASPACTVTDLIGYMAKQGHLRDAQVDAIKTYLYLKIACNCQPLKKLFCQGAFNSLDLDDLALSRNTRDYLKQNPAAAALLEYACLTNDAGEQVSPKLELQIKKVPESIDYQAFFRDAFYGVSYTDYLFSLPMGAGKTYLMAAIIYLDM